MESRNEKVDFNQLPVNIKGEKLHLQSWAQLNCLLYQEILCQSCHGNFVIPRMKLYINTEISQEN